MLTLRTIRNAAYAFLLVLAFVGVIKWWPELSHIWRGQWVTLAVVVIGMVLATCLQAHNFICFMPARMRAGLRTVLRIWAVGALVNYLGPLQPGLALRVLWLRHHEVSVVSSLTATARQVAASIWISLPGLAAGLLLLDAKHHVFTALLLALIFATTWALRGPLITWIARMRRPSWLVRRQSWLANAMGALSIQGLFGVALQYVVAAALIFYAYRQFGAPVSWGYAVLIACAIYISSLVAILPGNFGVLEGIYIAGGHALGLEIHEGAALALFLRGAHVLSCLLLLAALGTGGAGRSGVGDQSHDSSTSSALEER